MLQTILDGVTAFFHAIPFSGATWFVLVLLTFFVWLFAKANKRADSPINWEDLLIDSDTNRTSPYKIGYFIGLVVSTWIVISFADGGKLTYDIFGMWLTYLLGGAGWNTYVKSKSTTSTSGTFQQDSGDGTLKVDGTGRIQG